MFDTQVTTQESLSAEMKTFYEDTLIDNAEPKLVHDQFGDKYPIPKNNGKTIEFRKYAALPKALTPLTEGVTPTGNNLSVSTKEATINQFGDYIKLSDMLQLTTIDDNVVQSTKLLGSQSGRTLDTITREIVNAGTNVIYADKADGSEVLSRKALTLDSELSVDTIFRAVAQLKSMNADGISGSEFVAIIHPFVSYALMRSDDWVSIHQYKNPENIYQGEIGTIGGVRFVESTEAKIFAEDGCPEFYALTKDTKFVAGKTYYTKSSDTYSAASVTPGGAVTADTYYEKHYTAIFSTLVIGAHAYAVTDVTGGGLEHIIKQLGYGDDPLNQRSSVGWKATKTAEILSDEYMVRIESCVKRYSNKIEAN
jgi:N4-gp56 family major capsid protein